MPSENSCHRWVFREGQTSVCGETARSQLADSLAGLRGGRDGIVDALIRAGELEVALADANSAESHVAAGITNGVAAALAGHWPADASLRSLAAVAEPLQVPDRLNISTAEGFAYYALHPLAYAELVDRLQLSAKRAAVIGIRSIGATLSAVVSAALTKNRVQAERITVRPEGHPYDRKTHFSDAQLRWIAAQRSHEAEFLVVDEGPGLSGSSFLSVGEALLAAGVERRRIRFLCSRQVDPQTLVSVSGGARWSGFQTECVGPLQPPAGATIDIGYGKWRDLLPVRDAMPGEIPSWVSMERSKFLSGDARRLFKFAGLGRYGEVVGQRAQVLAANGFGPAFFGVHDGYAEYSVLEGRPARAEDLSRALLERMAEYLALRASAFRVSDVAEAPLEAMARFNYEQEFGETAPEWLKLEHSTMPVLCDGRMQPHEWWITPAGAIKTDGEAHGDDHFFPGPCDIAWDLAGTIVEWNMDQEAASALARRYAELAGDDPSSRIPAYVLAYATFRQAYCTMAAHAMQGSTEHPRLRKAAAAYKFVIERQVGGSRRQARPVQPHIRASEQSPAA